MPKKSIDEVNIHEMNKKHICDLLRNEEKQPLNIE